MKRAAAAAAATSLLAAVTMSACGGGNPYCSTVEDQTATLNSFGKDRTTAAYRTYAKTFQSIAKVSPETVRDDWTGLAQVTRTVLTAQKEAGISLENMSDTAKVKKLDSSQLQKLNDAYEAFNKTTDQRKAVVKNVQKECEITLQ